MLQWPWPSLFVPDVMKFPVEVADISHSQEHEASVTLTYDQNQFSLKVFLT